MLGGSEIRGYVGKMRRCRSDEDERSELTWSTGYVALNRIWTVGREPLVSEKSKNLGQGKPAMQTTVRSAHGYGLLMVMACSWLLSTHGYGLF
jgi:hypothetical protein